MFSKTLTDFQRLGPIFKDSERFSKTLSDFHEGDHIFEDSKFVSPIYH